MSNAPCRWGILGTATIARKNWQAIRLAENCTLAAVASRDLARSQQFIASCQSQVPFAEDVTAVGDYDALLARDDVDAVYIPLPTALRKEWVLKAARAGKHVLCEKPCSVTPADVREMIDACGQHNVQFMDGVMFMHSARLNRLREILAGGESIGQLRRIATQFSFCAPDDWVQSNIRTNSELEPHGCLGDLGWYNIRIVLCVMNGQLPKQVAGRMLAQRGRSDSPQPVPVEFSGELLFPGDVSASFFCSFQTEHQQWLHVSGSGGSLQISDFMLPDCGNRNAIELSQPKFEIFGCDFVMEKHTHDVFTNEYSNSMADSQETNLFREFGRLVQSGTPDPAWGRWSLATQRVLDACWQSAREGGVLIDVSDP